MKSLVLSILVLLVFSGFQQNPWKAAESAVNIENPIKDDKSSIEKGKKIFNNLCWSCHGKDGKGTGPASSSLKPKPADFTSDIIQKQVDGELFYKISEGRGNMAAYKNSLTTTQRWQLVNFIRTFKK